MEQGMNGQYVDGTLQNMPFRLTDDINETFIFDPSADDVAGTYKYAITVYYAGPNKPTYV